MKFILNIMLYLTQKLHMRLGGTVAYKDDSIILYAPKGRHFEVPKKYNLNSFKP